MAGADAVRLALVMVVVVLSEQQAQACIFGSGESCDFQCNCADGAICNDTTGACPGGCKIGHPRPLGNEDLFNWRGPGCRIGNVAYHKHATQSVTYQGWGANHAVDGLLPRSSDDLESQCSNTNSEDNAWWSVDLAKTYHIYNITIFNRIISHGDRTSHISISVSNSHDLTNATECAFYLGPLETGGNVTITCETGLMGRYVTLRKTGGSEPGIINICEVVVMGYEVIEEGTSSNAFTRCTGSVTGVSTVSTPTAPTEDGDCRKYLITLAVLFGIAAVINVGFIINCIRSKIVMRRTNPPTVQSEVAPKTDENYYNAAAGCEGLRPVSRTPEAPYDELHMEGNHVTAAPKYELIR